MLLVEQLASMALAVADRAYVIQNGVVRLEGELVGLVDSAGQAVEHPVRQVDDRAALVAHQVGVTAFAEVEEGGAGARMDVLDDLELVEALQHPVDRRRCHARRAVGGVCSPAPKSGGAQ